MKNLFYTNQLPIKHPAEPVDLPTPHFNSQIDPAEIKGARVELFFKHYNLYKNPRLKLN